MKKVIAAIIGIIAVAFTVYYLFPEQVAGFLIDKARNKAGLTRKEVKIADHNLVYLEGGQGPAILLLHGYTGNKDNWILFAPYLTKEYHVIVPDIPGYGESSKLETASYDLNSQIDRLHKFAQAIGLKEFHIVGNSMGGLFAGIYTVRHPEEILSLGLFNAAGVKSPQLSEVMKLMAKGENPLILKDDEDFSRVMGLVFVHPPGMPYPVKKMMIRTALANRSFYEKERREFAPDIFSLEKDLPAITAPTLIVWGDQDRVLDISSVPVFERGLKNHQTVISKNCGHLPMLEKPEETAAKYRDFIKGINK